MKMQHTVAAALIMGLASGALRHPPSITYNNRLHRDRAPAGSPAEAERMAAAAARRQRRAMRTHGGMRDDTENGS